MSYFKFLYRTRGLANTFTRALAIFRRFGITPEKSRRNLEMLCTITGRNHCRPSLPATAIIVNRYPDVFKDLVRKGAVLAVHGYRHINYKELLYEEQVSELQKAMDIFKQHGLPFTGFRCPYMSWNEHTLKSLNSRNFLWDSNRSILWDVLDEDDYHPDDWDVCKRILSIIYQPKDAGRYHAIPRIEDGVVEIPVSLPDDEILTDRLKVKDKNALAKIWNAMFEKSHERGELLTFQLHPERVPLFGEILEKILKKARETSPPVWIATLEDIARWWEERSNFSFSMERQSDSAVRVILNCSGRASVLIRNYDEKRFQRSQISDYLVIGERDFTLQSDRFPIIGLSLDFPMHAERYLKEEGWLYRKSPEKDLFSLHLQANEAIDFVNERRTGDFIESSKGPLLRFWRWPGGYRSALSVTGDIDCLTILDFFARLFKR